MFGNRNQDVGALSISTLDADRPDSCCAFNVFLSSPMALDQCLYYCADAHSMGSSESDPKFGKVTQSAAFSADL